MGLVDILAQYANQAAAPPQAAAHEDYAAVAAQAPPDVLGGGIAQALQSEQAGSFASSIEKLFENSNPQQRTGLLSELVRAAGPAILSSVAGGALSHLGQPGAAVAPSDADAVTPSQAGELAAAARRNDPGIVSRVGSFYAQHPMVVKALGAAALAIAMNHMARRA